MERKIISLLLGFLSVLVASCDSKVPIDSFSNAHGAFEKARSVNSEFYSPREFGLAQKNLETAHTILIQNEKIEEAEKSALESEKKSHEAYKKSLALYSRDVLQRADAAVKDAESAYGEKFSPSLFNKAEDLLVAATEKYDNKEYEKSIPVAEEAYKIALASKKESIGNKPELKSQIDIAKSSLKKIESYDYEKYALDEHGEAKKYLSKAEESYANDSLKKGFEEIHLAQLKLDLAYESVLKGVSSEKIDLASGVVQSAEDKKGAKFAAEEMSAAKEALENAKKYFSMKNYMKAITYADEAVRLGDEVISECDKKQAELALQVESKKKSPKKSDKFYYYKVKTWVKYNDCLWKIARKYYKNPRLWKIIHRANKSRIKNPDLIRPGWVIKVPKLKK